MRQTVAAHMTVEAALRRYQVMAYLVGTGLLILTLIGVPLQYIANQPEVVKIVGPIHGFLYIIYLAVAYDLARRERWSLGRIAAMVLCGLVPFMAFIVERRVTRRFRAEEALDGSLAVATGTGPEMPPGRWPSTER